MEEPELVTARRLNLEEKIVLQMVPLPLKQNLVVSILVLVSKI